MSSHTAGLHHPALLPLDTVGAYFSAWRDLHHHVADRNRELPPSAQLGGPKLNAAVMESLAVHLINLGHLRHVQPELVRAARGLGRLGMPDAWAWSARDERKLVEVKACGPSGWQRVSAADVNADLFLWINAAPLIRGADVLEVWAVEQLGRYMSAGQDVYWERTFGRLIQHSSAPFRVDAPLS